MGGRRAGPASGNLTVAVTSFVGRRGEIAQVRRGLSASRLVTLTGVGGVGKTRLAIEAARDARRAFADGVWLVDLAMVTDPAMVPQAVATALGVRDQSTRSALDQLTEYLADRRLLLVLDNCEHLLDACALTVDRLLRACPELRVLATSRRTLDTDGEHVHTVEPLSTPDPQRRPSARALGQYEAVRLLVDRAVAVEPGFAVTERNRDAVARLCAGLDGIPLAIELAATRLRTMSVEEVVERLEDRFGLLTGGRRTALPRQRTLRALIDWSHELCSDDERRLWARLSVFAGGFDRAAAEGVCADDELPADMILDLLDRLVAQSIIVRAGTAYGGRPRFRMLETIRQYGQDRLVEPGRWQALRARHRDHFLSLARRTAQDWCGPGQEDALERLRADHGNLRAALDWCLTEPDGAEAALGLCAALRWHWCAAGFLSEGRRWLDQALALPGPPGPARREALWVAGWVSLLQGDRAAARQRFADCRRLAGQVGDRVATAWADGFTGAAALFDGCVEEAVTRYEQAARALEEVGDTGGVLMVLFQLAIARSHLGDAERAAAAARRGIEISESRGEHLVRSYALWALAFGTWLQGEPDEARRLVVAGLELQQGFRDSVGAGLMIELLAWIAASKSEFERAACLLGTATSVWRSIGTGIAAFGPELAEHHERCAERTVRALRRPAFQAAFEQGVRPTVEEAIAYATRRRTSGGERSPAPVLTRREHEVAVLIGQGLSNRQIAERMVISPRTVDTHVEHVLAKLGFSARTQIAAWVAEQQAVESH